MGKYMIKKSLYLIFALATLAQAAVPDTLTPPPELKPLPQQIQAARYVAGMLTLFHYKPTPLNDAMSEKIFDQYVKSLDAEKFFFTQSDVDQLTELRTKLDDAIVGNNLSPAFSIFNLYTKRASERFAYAKTLLKDGFDFNQQESIQYRRDKEAWPQSDAEMRDLWRKRVKNDWLRLKLAGMNDKTIIETLGKRYDNFRKRLSRAKSEEAFESFMNAYTMAVDPHTNYMGPRATEEFDIAMKLSLIGIGAVLADKNDYTTIRELVPGGPAALSGQLHVGDRILGVAQGKNGTVEDVLGWRLDDTVRLIRGTADSTVVLDILPASAGPDGKHQLVPLVRKKITLEAQSAKKAILPVTDGDATRRIGVITLPSFYEDFEARKKDDPGYTSATRDVARLLGELKSEKVDAVLIDLRNNGGGSLGEAIELSGLFIGKVPVLQERDAKGAISVLSNSRSDIAWDGPLGVLINRGSASASEIFAAAIQDYGRGLVIGERSFGKGTVQNVANLDRIAKSDKSQFGELKYTTAQFFRVNGGTTQLRGVTPDIAFPTVSEGDDLGESSFENALPWMQIKAANYSPSDALKALEPVLAKRNDAREMNDKGVLCLKQDIAEYELQYKKNAISLNEAERRKERIIQEARLASCEATDDNEKTSSLDNTARKSGRGKAKALRDDGLQSEERNLATELADEKARKEAKDILLDEAARILGDEVGLLEPGTILADRTKASAP